MWKSISKKPRSFRIHWNSNTLSKYPISEFKVAISWKFVNSLFQIDFSENYMF